MLDFFAKDYTGGAFALFGPQHMVVLAILLLINLSFFWLRRSPDERWRTAFRYGLAGLILLNEAAWHSWNFATGQWTIQTMLPLHLCSILVYSSVYLLISRNRRVYELCYFLGIGAAIQAILTPDLGIYGFPHFRFFQSFISHGGIVTAAIYMTVVEGYRPYLRSMVNVLVFANLFMLCVTGVNLLIGSNYMFTLHVPETPSLLDLLGPWPWYLLATEAIAVVVFFLLYLPFALNDFRQRPALAQSESL